MITKRGYPDESLAGFVVRATATNLRRRPSAALRGAGIRCNDIGSLCSRSRALAPSIAEWAGVLDPRAIARMFHEHLAGRNGWINFFGEPLRAFYREVKKRRLAPGTLKRAEYVRATWSLKPFAFDPLTKERLIDTCPQCRRELGWSCTYGVAFCDHCSRQEQFMHWTWNYPGLDLRDFPQPKVEVEDEEALDFVTGLIDPYPGRREASRRLIPDMWSDLPNGELFEVVMSFATVLHMDPWDRTAFSRTRHLGARLEKLTPDALAVAGRAIIDGRKGFEQFVEITRREVNGERRKVRYGVTHQIGPIGAIDPHLCAAAREALQKARELYLSSIQRSDLLPLCQLSEKYGVDGTILRALVDTGLMPTIKFDDCENAPILMSDTAVAKVASELRNVVSARVAAGKIGVPRTSLDDLQRLGLVARVAGSVLKLLEADNVYYVRDSVEQLVLTLQRQSVGAERGVSLSVALRALGVRCPPWAAIVAAIVDGRLPVITIKPGGKLGERFAIVEIEELANVLKQLTLASREVSSQWIGNNVAAQLLGTNGPAVWRLSQLGILKRYARAPAYMPFRRSEVESLARRVIFTPEIVRRGEFVTYRSASTWCREQHIEPLMELKTASWKLYPRPKVERALNRRQHHQPPKPIRIGGAYPKEIKVQLLDRVKEGVSVRQAAVACNVSYVTAKTWVRSASEQRHSRRK
jgi:hypothetical protein